MWTQCLWTLTLSQERDRAPWDGQVVPEVKMTSGEQTGRRLKMADLNTKRCDLLCSRQVKWDTEIKHEKAQHRVL